MPEHAHVECHMCNQVDNHPKHSFLTRIDAPWTERHYDCCASVGCESCANKIKDAGVVKGDELRAHLVAKG